MNSEGAMLPSSESLEPPILFYTSIKRLFRSHFIGYLFQLTQHRRVVLLSEELDEEMSRLLDDRRLFPGLIQQIHIGQYDIAGEGRVTLHRRMLARAREIVDATRPKIVFSPGADAFEQYLRRYSKRVYGAINIFCPTILLCREVREGELLLELHGAETNFPAWLPRRARRALASARRKVAQLFYYVLTPIYLGELPFLGVNGIYHFDDARLVNIDYCCVYTHDNRQMLVRDGAPADRLRVIPHPLIPGSADELWRALGIFPLTVQKRSNVLTCFFLLDQNFGFRRDDLAPIPDAMLYATRVAIIKCFLNALPGWEIRIKSHPMSEASPIYKDIRREIVQLSGRIVWIPPDDPADPHIMASGAVAVFPPVSSVMFSTIIQRPGLPAMVIDVLKELRGDPCVGMGGVVTITSMQELELRLSALASEEWKDTQYRHDTGDFETLDEFVATLLPPQTAADK